MLRRLLIALAATLDATLAAPAQDAPAKSPVGRFALVVGNGDRTERFYLLALGVEAGKPSARVVAVAPGQPTPALGPATFGGGVLRLPLTKGGNRYELEVRPDPKEPTRYLGSLDVRVQTFRATLEPTTLDKLTVADTVVPTAPSAGRAAIAKLQSGETLLRNLADKLQDATAGERLTQEADAVAMANAPEIDRLRRKLALAGEGAASVEAAQDLLALAVAVDAPAAEVAMWVGAITAEARPYGPKVVARARADLARRYARAGCGNVAIGFALEAAADPALTKQGRVNALRVLQRAQAQVRLAADADATAKRLAALDAEVDAEYRKAVPPFAPQKYAGRTDKAANRVAVLELFTGAECRPCVAADVALDALTSRYGPADVVLLQYHVHYPTPDPLANPDTAARLGYYLDRHPDGMGDNPGALVNGKPAAGGGGGLAQAEAKYTEFATLLDKSLEATTAVGVRGGVKRTGDDLTVAVEVTGAKGLGDKAVLRLVLTEGSVRYVGGNGVRFHRHVVRSLLGTGGGVAVGGIKGGQSTTTHSLKALRDELTEHMHTWGGPLREFVFAERPLDLKRLTVVAMVQDDATGEVVQAAAFDVAE